MAEAHHVDILIIGAGAAGQAAAEAAAAAGEANGAGAAPASGTAPGAARALSICLVSNEDRLPYKRTKISKTPAQGFEADAFAVQSAEWYREQGVELLTGTEVTRIDPDRRVAELGHGEALITFERLILATGAAPRLPEADAGTRGQIHCTHDIADIEELRAAALRAVAAATEGEKPRAVVLGGGVLGLEVGYDLHHLGLHVAVVDRNERLMHRELDAYAGEIAVEQCRRNGMDLYLGEADYEVRRSAASDPAPTPAGAEPYPGSAARDASTRAASARTAWARTAPGPAEVVLPRTGVTIQAEVVAAALGVVPHTHLATAARLDTGRGIRVDRELRTSHPAVFAAGDCAEHPDGRVTHLWRDALRQGAVAGANAVADLVDRPAEVDRYVYEPFRLKCEIFGTYFFSLCRPSPQENDDYGHRRYYDGPRYVHAYLSRRGNAGGAATAAGDDRTRHAAEDERVAGVIMVNDKERRGRYEQAVSEGWTVHQFEAAFELR
ncbi:MAG: FAD-dependent oxidoreductase [Spirochaetota bacterium]